MKQVIIAIALMVFATACGSQKEVASTNNPSRSQKQRGSQGRPAPPSVEEIFKMDANNDGQLSKSEVKGPLLNDFAKIDTNNDGFISKTELQNAPKPQRRQGGPPRN